MPVQRFTFASSRIHCPGCGVTTKVLRWQHEPVAVCACGAQPYVLEDVTASAHTVIGDEIDRTIEHGLCHADGTPRRFRSRQELKAAERALGYRLLEKGERFRGDEAHGARVR